MELTQEQMEIVKAEYPEWFKPEFEVGKWYTRDSKDMMCFTGNFDCDGDPCGYGLLFSGEWLNECSSTGWGGELIPATPEEVEQALISEAKRRYKDIKNIGSDLTQKYDRVAKYSFSEFHYEKRENRLYSAPDGEGGLVVFDSGQWASVLTPEKPSLQDDIQALKDRWPDINFTVIAEGKK